MSTTTRPLRDHTGITLKDDEIVATIRATTGSLNKEVTIINHTGNNLALNKIWNQSTFFNSAELAVDGNYENTWQGCHPMGYENV